MSVKADFNNWLFRLQFGAKLSGKRDEHTGCLSSDVGMDALAFQLGEDESVGDLHLTVATRELFFPQTTMGKERIVLELLHGINEIHHTLANFLLRWGNGEEDWTPEVLSRQLVEIAVQYRILNLLQSSVEFARARNPEAGV
jgi:hypothetical protein